MAWEHYYINCEKIYDKEERRDEPFCFYKLDIPPHGGIRREWTTRGMKHGQASIFFVEFWLEDDDPDGVWEAYGQKRDSEYSYTVHAEEADPEKLFAYTLYQDGSLRAGFDIDTDAACAILVLPRAQAITAAQLRDAWEQVKAAPRVSGAAEEIIRKELLGGAEDVLCLAIFQR